MAKHNLTLLAGELAVCRLGARDPVPEWALAGEMFSVTRTADELSVVCEAGLAPDGVTHERGWRCLKVEGPFAFSVVGVLSALTGALARAGVSLFAVSTFDTDYLLVKDADLDRAVAALAADGHTVRR
jgi:hypothetical protein